jgi:hypothetical protein
MSNSNVAVRADNKTKRVSAYPVRNMKKDLWFCIKHEIEVYWSSSELEDQLRIGQKDELDRIEMVMQMKDYLEFYSEDYGDGEILDKLLMYYRYIDNADHLTVEFEHEINSFLEEIATT